MPTPHLETVKQYLRALEQGADGDDLVTFFTDDVVQEEFPNRLVPSGARRNLGDILEAAKRGKSVLRAQRFEVLSAVQNDTSVALEVQWTGTLAIPMGALPAGGEMRARFAMFIDFRGDKIARQRNYDCFDPW